MIVKSTSKYLVIDDFMDQNELVELRNFLKKEPYFYENAFEWNKVWHPLDGKVLVTTPNSYGETERAGGKFPTDTPLDLFFRAMEKESEAIAQILQCPESDIKYVVATYLYRAGWGLSWHDDAGPYCGAFAFYIHDEWRGNWGGELMILPEERLYKAEGNSIDLGYKQGGGFGESAHVAQGIGEFIMPLPNRIVFMSKALIHSINKVAPHAGENMRFSVSGFFLQ